MTSCLPIAALLFIANAYSSLLATSNNAAPISNSYQDFAACSCDLTPALCDNYCCCDSQCGSAATWSNNNQCLATSAPLQVPCGQSTRGLGAISDLACVYFSNRGTIGYYFQSLLASTITYPTPALFASASSSNPSTAQTSLLTTLSLATPYSANNQYLKTSATSFLYVPVPGPNGFCTPGLVNLTTVGTFTCKLVPTSQNCVSLNSPYAGSASICLNGDCSASSSAFTVPASTATASACQNVLTGLSISAVLGYSNGGYVLQSPNIASPATNPSATLNAQLTVTVSINIAPASGKSGNPGYLQSRPITMSGGIAGILDASTGNCATSASNPTISVPFAVDKTVSCPSPSPCTSNYYIDTIGSLTLSLNKYAAQSAQTIGVGGNATLGCKSEHYRLSILYSSSGWLLDPQYYIVAASLSATAAPDNSTPTTKYLTYSWTYVDPAAASTPPSNSFYTYFSYLWTPLRQKFGMA